ncbi:hypothetical protein PLESTB_000558900 [Pleodorina starrii]|uniref:Reverse transcriptase domain-containing protein n=1 Tax=Pleodorina starrii TaxID=330485 RepID=A0A9W6F0A2_9CHLO|nr:hypothetical protein PLESTB_000558900 [Pleodorina starrii]GLC74564.1 hypothetical protein PLESTF_001527700 [Pleodorina starrii]
MAELGGQINATQAIDLLGKELAQVLSRVFGRPRGRAQVRGQGDAPWWTEECAVARTAMLNHKARMRTEGTLNDPTARAEFSRLRTHYQRLIRNARDAYRTSEFESLLGSCQSNPRAFWKIVNATLGEDCPISEVGVWSEYFENLFNGNTNAGRDADVEAILSFINGVHGREGGGGWEDSAGARPSRVELAASLNSPFTVEEVGLVISSLSNNKSSGLDSVPAECYKYAKREVEGRFFNVLTPHVHRLFEHIRSTGDFPAQFEVSCLTPIHKKGDVHEKGNYRGLAVGGALAKCYAAILERRLSRWGELAQARSPFQGGFRAKIGTIHNLLLLRHLIDRHRTGPPSSTPLFVCQVDFEKAFDRVPRQLLWQRLRERGLHGAMLDALMAGYDRVVLRVKVNGKLGDPFEAMQGVKQGCPLSPTLFGFFVEGFADYVEAKDKLAPAAMCANECPVVDGLRVPLILYADDLNLFAFSHLRLMCLLQALSEWCTAFGLTVHTRKCEVVYFHPSQNLRDLAYRLVKVGMRRIVGNTIRFEEMEWARRARYLGLHYGPEAPFEACTDELFGAGQRAVFALVNKLRRRGLFVPRVALKCFDVQICAILSYGVQVWGPSYILQVVERDRDPQGRYCYFEKALENRMVGLQRMYLKMLAGLRKIPDNKILFREFGQRPLHVHWASLIYRFWNKLVDAKGSVFHRVFREEIRLALQSDLSGHGWGALVLRGLRCLGQDHWPEPPPGLDLEGQVDFVASRSLNIGNLIWTLEQRFDEDWLNSRLLTPPREFVSDNHKPGVKMCRHTHWMGMPKHTAGYIPPKPYASLLRFRLGAWPIENNRPAGRQRSERTCRVCDSGTEDEYHVLMECSAYDDIRQGFSTLGVILGDYISPPMLAVTGADNQRGLAELVHNIWVRRSSMLV